MSVVKCTHKGAKHKMVRSDLVAKGMYNRKILRNFIRLWATRRGYKPSFAVYHKWADWRM